jgi:hypothetical protein
VCMHSAVRWSAGMAPSFAPGTALATTWQAARRPADRHARTRN